jgi:hypothetical protein
VSRNVKALLVILGGAILLLLLIGAFAAAMTVGGMLRGAQSMIMSSTLFILHVWGLAIALLVASIVAGVVFIVGRSQR